MANNDRDLYTIDAMEKWGGSFVAALGRAARRADPDNLERIKKAFPEYWADYEKRGLELEEMDNNKD